jgi:hypothetical protein
LASYLVLAAIVWRAHSRWGDLSNWYTDHLRHVYAVQVFLHRGWEIYRLRFDDALSGIPYPNAVVSWGTVPYAYPPGALLLYSPLSWVGRRAALSTPVFGKLCVLYLLALAHLALWAVGAVLRATASPARIPVFALAWVLLAYAASEGFYDPAWVGLGTLAMVLLLRGHPRAAVLALTGAGLLSYRAVVLVPLGVLAVWRWTRIPGAASSARSWVVAAVTLISGGVIICAFLPLREFAGAFRFAPALTSRGWSADLLWVLVASGTALGVCALSRAPCTASSVLVATVLALVDVPQWWHALVVLVPLLSVGVASSRAVRWQRWALLIWAVVVADHAWRCSPVHFYQALAGALHG